MSSGRVRIVGWLGFGRGLAITLTLSLAPLPLLMIFLADLDHLIWFICNINYMLSLIWFSC